MINIIRSSATEIEINPKEVSAYLGYYSADCRDCINDDMMQCCEKEFLGCAKFIACYEKVPVEIADGIVDLGFRSFNSHSLAKNLTGCDYAYIMAATTGIEAQRLIERNGITDPLKGLVTDCIGSAAIEAFCDKINLSLGDGEYLRPRFSPGYGDLALDYQKDIIEFLQTNKNIGMSLTESLMMIPVKSVTAIIGIGKEKNKCTGPGCMICSGVNCPYR